MENKVAASTWNWRDFSVFSVFSDFFLPVVTHFFHSVLRFLVVYPRHVSYFLFSNPRGFHARNHGFTTRLSVRDPENLPGFG